MPTEALLFSAAGTQGWTAPAASVLTQFVSIGSNQIAVLSYDPTVAVTNYFTPSANGVDKSVIAVTQSVPTQLNAFPVDAGEGIFVAARAAGSVFLSYEISPQ